MEIRCLQTQSLILYQIFSDYHEQQVDNAPYRIISKSEGHPYHCLRNAFKINLYNHCNYLMLKINALFELYRISYKFG